MILIYTQYISLFNLQNVYVIITGSISGSTIKAIAADSLSISCIDRTKRNRMSAKDIGYGLYLCNFLGLLSYHNTPKALSRFIKRSHVFIWKWMRREIQTRNNIF